ncbi:hybrid sensor histidine kinase/response regulator [Polyangium jinanense]|uniref:histidine kinase n=1 Tax=Polyangium jinanense TaxID=2829994 RepID=A0A9X4AUF0_9BACT|nr:hybrid sensor histidine kinase/response regulator [Polyangium jinanense]MDC3955887.1 response regulator [Polyangium jinanense]MDC3983246.1 response regulator [Polyangium jinanense]MDC3985174.1 response regulator [Polyangium jinanense]
MQEIITPEAPPARSTFAVIWPWLLAVSTAMVSVAISAMLIRPLGGLFLFGPIGILALLALVVGFLPSLVSLAVSAVGFGFLSFAMASGNAHSDFVFTYLSRLVVFFVTGVVVILVMGSERRLRQRAQAERLLAERSRLEAERAAAAARASLAALHESEERHRALAEALREADRRKDEFLAMLSHELRNPLAPVRNSLYVLGRAAPGSEQAKRAERVIERQIVHMTRLIDDLLDVTRISRGKILLQHGPIELCELVYRAAEDHRSVFEQGGVTLGVEVPVRPVWVNGDGTRLAQVVGNLLHNAAKFTDRGGRVHVTVSRAEPARACISVSDNGAGIAAEMLPKLFDAFTQADRTITRSRGGLGLGLSLVKGLVELHGGDVRAESDGPGRGATFTIELPVGEPVASNGAASVSREPHRCSRILVIEDNHDAAASLAEALALGQRNVRVEVAHSGSEGIAKARIFDPEVILCDLGLPGMNGYEVARALRADSAHRDRILIALTGYASPEDRKRSRAAGFDRHLAKPLDLKTLDRLLAELCGPARPPERVSAA